MPETDLERRVAVIEEGFSHLNAALRQLGILPALLPVINPIGFPSGQFPPAPSSGSTGTVTHVDVIEEDRQLPDGKKCKILVKVTVKYTHIGRTVVTDAAGKVVRTCDKYRIEITIEVTETCPVGVESSPAVSSTHTTEREYCNDEADGYKQPPGETVGFDGVKTATILYKNGTQVKVEKRGEKITVTVTYPDGTTTTTSIPP